MSTAALRRIEAVLALRRQGLASTFQLADALRGNAQAMEALPYAELRRLEALADDLDQAADQEREGFASDLPQLLAQLEQWLSTWPTHAGNGSPPSN